MSAHRTLAVVAAAGIAPLLVTALAAAPAQAHGAPTNPVSRAAACGTEGGQAAQSEACRAAIAVSGPTAVAQWDNLRVADVAGRDREVIPDGQLCSGGINAFRGLDLPRPDWPATRLAAGKDYTFTYRGTIPHQGTFRLYVTNDNYDPRRPLSWSDLETQPFLRTTDPRFRGGSYRFAGTLPAGKTGRHVIYTIWQNSDTPDTYYSCSDVDFAGAATGNNGGATNGGATNRSGTNGSGTNGAGTNGSNAAPPAVPPARTAAAAPATQPVAQAGSTSFAFPLTAGVAAALFLASLAALVRRRRS